MLQKRIQLIDSKSDWHKIKNLKLIVLFSLWEGFPNVILESMSYSIPCLGSKETRGINDLLNDNRGYLTTLTSSKKAARKILEILSNDEKYKYITENAYKFSKKFDKVTILKDLD